MNARDAIKLNINMGAMVVGMYLDDLSDADLLIRPVPGCNHIAWQLGHLIVSENTMIDGICPGFVPALPAGFQEQHANDRSGIDDPQQFRTKAEYLQLYAAQREATLKALDSLSEADLDRSPPEQFKAYTQNWGDLFSLQGGHWMMHAGQWAVTRRKLGKPPLF